MTHVGGRDAQRARGWQISREHEGGFLWRSSNLPMLPAWGTWWCSWSKALPGVSLQVGARSRAGRENEGWDPAHQGLTPSHSIGIPTVEPRAHETFFKCPFSSRIRVRIG